MKVVFLEEVPNVAGAGDVKEVKNGYARNFLFPRSLAVLATREQLRRVDALKRGAAQRLERAETRAETLSQELEGLTVVINARTSPAGRLYGSVSAATIAEEISKATGHEVAAREVVLEQPIKTLGSYQTPIRLSQEVETAITVDVVEAEEKEEEGKAKARRRKPRMKKAAVAAAAAPTAVEAAPPAAEEAAPAQGEAEPVSEVEEAEAVAAETEEVAEEAPAEEVVAEAPAPPEAEEAATEAVEAVKAEVEEAEEEEPTEEIVAEAAYPTEAEVSPVDEETIPEVAEGEAPIEEQPVAEAEATTTKPKRARARAKAGVEQEEVDQKAVEAAVRRAKRRATRAKAKATEEPVAGSGPSPGEGPEVEDDEGLAEAGDEDSGPENGPDSVEEE